MGATVKQIFKWEKGEVNLETQRDPALLAVRKTIFGIIKLNNDVINIRSYDIFRHRQNRPFIYKGQFSNIKVIQNNGVRTAYVQTSIYIFFVSRKHKY